MCCEQILCHSIKQLMIYQTIFWLKMMSTLSDSLYPCVYMNTPAIYFIRFSIWIHKCLCHQLSFGYDVTINFAQGFVRLLLLMVIFLCCLWIPFTHITQGYLTPGHWNDCLSVNKVTLADIIKMAWYQSPTKQDKAWARGSSLWTWIKFNLSMEY